MKIEWIGDCKPFISAKINDHIIIIRKISNKNSLFLIVNNLDNIIINDYDLKTNDIEKSKIKAMEHLADYLENQVSNIKKTINILNKNCFICNKCRNIIEHSIIGKNGKIYCSEKCQKSIDK